MLQAPGSPLVTTGATLLLHTKNGLYYQSNAGCSWVAFTCDITLISYIWCEYCNSA